MKVSKSVTRLFAITLAGLAAIMVLAGGLAGCARKKDPRITIEWFTDVSPELLKLYTTQLIPQFEKNHPNIHIRLNASLGDIGFEAKLMTLVASGLAPD